MFFQCRASWKIQALASRSKIYRDEVKSCHEYHLKSKTTISKWELSQIQCRFTITTCRIKTAGTTYPKSKTAVGKSCKLIR